MKKALALVLLAALATPAAAWEPETTHTGLAEQAALASRLHKRLVTLGFTGGLFEQLTIPPADAPALTAALKLLSPTHGMVPDARGRQVALAWLSAGAALADLPAKEAANHFYDPVTHQGWRAPDRGVLAGLSDKVRESIGRAALPERGVPAPDWVTDKANPFNLESFLSQYAKAVSAKTPGERSRHMAAALVAAGAMMHALGDLGTPARVRGDEASFLEPMGAGPDDLGSRFERIAALAHGRLGVPAPDHAITRAHLREYFDGLALDISQSYFSPNTLPAPTRVGTVTRPKLARPLPALPDRLNLMAASREEGTTVRDAAGTCLAKYKVEHGVLSFWIDDDCMLEEIAAILPDVASYEAGLLDFLLRGDLTIDTKDGVLVSGKGLGAGVVEVLVEDDRGVRTSLGAQQIAGGTEQLIKVPLPAAGTRVVAVFRGADAAGEPIVAVGAMPLSH